MAIRFKYDATGVVVPQNASNRKYGQALVLQQKRFDQDQQQMMQQQTYDQQRMAQQQAFLANRDAQNAVNRQQLGQRQGMANLNAGFGANVAQVAPVAQQMPIKQVPVNNAAQGMDLRQQALARLSKAQSDAGVLNSQSMVPGQQALAGLNVSQRFGAATDMGYPTSQSLMERQQVAEMEQRTAAQMQAQERASFEEARKAGEYDPVTAAKIQQTYADASKTDMSKELDAAQKAEWNADNNAKRRKLLENRNPNPSPEELASRNLRYYVPSIRDYVSREQSKQLGPDVEVQVYEDGKLKPGEAKKAPVKEPPSLPASYDEYYDMDYEKNRKTLEAKKEEMRTRAEDDGSPYTDEDKLEDDAYAALKGQYEKQRGRSAAAKQQSQPATPPPAMPAPPSGMQDLEPTYNTDGTTAETPQPQPMLSQAASETEAAITATPLPGDQAGSQSDQNPWSEFAEAEQQAPSTAMPDSSVATQAATSAQPAQAPDFGKLTANATDSADRVVFGKLQGVYETQTPEIQSAISVLVDTAMPKRARAEAAMYLKSAGIDLEKLAGPKTGTGSDRLDRYQNNLNTTMR